MDRKKIEEVLTNHLHWLREDCEGWEEMRADLSGAYLRGAYLSGAYLRGADLRGADLRGADLSGADLSGAYLRGADLRGAYLSGAYLRGADLSGAYLSGADLSGAYLRGADLSGAYLSGAKNIPFIPMACPDSGSFIGWKKVFGRGFSAIIKLRIPEEAKRCSATGRKCRCEFAEVLEIESLLTGERMDYIENVAYAPVTYITGRIVYPDSFDEDRWKECSHGIHFFINRQEAVDYK